MRLDQSLDLDKVKKPAIKQGREQELFAILIQFGYDFLEIEVVIDEMAVSACGDMIKQFVKTRLKKSITKFAMLCQTWFNYFYTNTFIKPKDQFLLLAANQEGFQKEVEQIANYCGLTQQEQKIKEQIQQIWIAFGKKQQVINKRKQIEQKMDKIESYCNQIQLFLNQFKGTITFPEQLKGVQPIFFLLIKKDNEQKSFQLIKNLDILHPLAQNFIKQNLDLKIFIDSQKNITLTISVQSVKDHKTGIKQLKSQHISKIILDYYNDKLQIYGLTRYNNYTQIKQQKISYDQSAEMPIRVKQQQQNDKQNNNSVNFIQNVEKNSVRVQRQIMNHNLKSKSQNIVNDSLSSKDKIRDINIKYQLKKNENLIQVKQDRNNQNINKQFAIVLNQLYNDQSKFIPNWQFQISRQNRKVLILYYSEELVHSVRIVQKTVTNKQINIKIEKSQFVWNNQRVILIGFQFNTNNNNKDCYLYINKGSLIPFKQDKIHLSLQLYQQLSIMPISFHAKENTNISKLRNFSLFESIPFILNKLIKSRQYDERLWLKDIYQLYLLNNFNFEEYKLYFSRKISGRKFSTDHTKIFLYLFYAVYHQNAEQLILSFELFEKMSFPTMYEKIKTKQHQKMIKFYQQIQRFHIIIYKDNINKEETNQIIKECLQYKHNKNIYSFLAKICKQYPPFMQRFIQQIFDQAKKRQKISPYEYLFMTIKYFTYLIKNKQKHQISRTIIKFIDQLIQICKKNPITKNQQIHIEDQKIKFLFINPGKYIVRWCEFRIQDESMSQFYLKCKQLLIISQNSINFINPILPQLCMKCKTIIKGANCIKMSIAMLFSPKNQMDIRELQNYYRFNSVDQSQIYAIIKTILNHQIQTYTMESFVSLIQFIFNENSSSCKIQIYKILAILDKQICSHKTDEKSIFLTRIFKIFLSKVQFISQQKNSFTIDQQLFKRYLQILFQFQNKQFKKIYLSTIIAKLKKTFLDQYDYVIYQIEMNLTNPYRQQWISYYIETCDVNTTELQKIVIKFLGNSPYIILTLSQKYGNKYQEVCKNIIKYMEYSE